MYSPLWKITHLNPSVLCTPPFEKSSIKAHWFYVLPPLKNHPSKPIGFMYSPLWKITVFDGPLFRSGCLFQQIRYTVFLTYELGQQFTFLGCVNRLLFLVIPSQGTLVLGRVLHAKLPPRTPSCNPFASRAAHFSLYNPWYKTRKKIITVKIKIIHIRHQITAIEEQKNFPYHPTADLSCRSVCTPNSPPKPPL